MMISRSPQYIWQRPDWPAWRYDVATVLLAVSEARLAQGRLLGAVHAIGIESSEIDFVLRDIWIQEAIATSAIEGQTLDLDAVRSSVTRKVQGSLMGSSCRSVEGLIDVMADAVRSGSVPLDHERLCSWQGALFPDGRSGAAHVEVGRYRTIEEPMQIVSGRPDNELVHYQAPASKNVLVEMDMFLDWTNNRTSIDALVKAAIAHLWFETIHPFHDGNGRVGRSIIDWIIAHERGDALRLYSISCQIKENREKYYKMLNEAQKGDLDVTIWIIWFLNQFGAACQKSLKYVNEVLENNCFWTRIADKNLNTRQVKVLKPLVYKDKSIFPGGLSRDQYTKITDCSVATATRDLIGMLSAGALITQGIGKSTRYYVNILHRKYSNSTFDEESLGQ